MAVYLLVIALVVLAAGLYMASMNQPDQNQQDMAPNGIDSFKATTNQEGAVVPVMIGEGRLSANLLWFGNLVTEEIVEEMETGGKGGGGGGNEDVVTGYRYYMDVWEAICVGPDVEIVQVFQNDKPINLIGTLNPGDTLYFPTEAGQYSAPLNPVAHVFMSRQWIGDNVSSVPTYHWAVKKTSNAPLNHANLTNGTNPAAAIYDILIMSGTKASSFVLSSFQDAADYWYDKGYGINLALNKQEETRNIIKRIFTYVDGNLRVDNQDRFELVAWKDTDTYQYEIDEEDLKDFNFRRRSWYDVYTDFRANFIYKQKNYTQRTLRVRNTAVKDIIGQDKQITIDLTAFNDITAASKRLWELMKQLSYPEAEASAKVSLKYSKVKVGDVVRVSYSPYEITNMDFRVIGIDVAKADSNEISWNMRQLTTTLFDTNFGLGGEPQWVEPDYSPQEPLDVEFFELPYTSRIEYDYTAKFRVSYLVLVARAGNETGFQVHTSGSGSNYSRAQTMSTFSQVGTLDEDYPADTYSIDDETGILYTPEREDPKFGSLFRNELFTKLRFAIIDEEILAFQTVDYEGEESIRLTGVIRGILNTPIETHTAGSKIWITSFRNNILSETEYHEFNAKVVTTFGGEVFDISEVSPITVTETQKAAQPWTPWNAYAERDGVTINVTVAHTTKATDGAGVLPAESQKTVEKQLAEGFVLWWTSVDSTVNEERYGKFDYINGSAGNHTLYIAQINSLGFQTDTIEIVVGPDDGDYFCDDHLTENYSFEKIQYGSQNWIDIMNRNATRLNDEVLKISGLIDVDLSGIADTNAIAWNSTSEKYEPVDWLTTFPTSTTTSTTSTTNTQSTTTNTQSTTTSSTSTTTSSSSTTNTQSTTTSSTSTTTESQTSTSTVTNTGTTTTNTQSTTSSSSTTTTQTSSTSTTSTSTTTTNTVTESTSTSTTSTSSSSTTTTTTPPGAGGAYEGEDVMSDAFYIDGIMIPA